MKSMDKQISGDDLLPYASFSMGAFVSMDIPERKLILSPWLPESGLIFIHSYRGVGKTRFAMSAAYAAATGTDLMGFKAGEPVKTLYIDGELPPDDLQKRLLELGPVTPNLMVISAGMLDGATINLSDAESQIRLEKTLAAEEIKLIFIDSITMLNRMPMSENSDEWWSLVEDWARVQRNTGRTVTFLGHDNKARTHRGTGKKEDIMDAVIHLKHPQDYEPEFGLSCELHYTKSRGFWGEDAAPLSIRLEGEQWVCESMEENTFTKVVRLINEGLTRKDVEIELNVNKSGITRHCKKAEQLGLIKENQGRMRKK